MDEEKQIMKRALAGETIGANEIIEAMFPEAKGKGQYDAKTNTVTYDLSEILG